MELKLSKHVEDIINMYSSGLLHKDKNFSLKYSYLLYGTETRISSSTDGPLGSYTDMTLIVELLIFFCSWTLLHFLHCL